MKDTKPNWNPRVPRHKIWQLYHNDALGLQDEDLVNDVGMSLLLRVESCLLDELTYSQASTPGLTGRRDEWREIARDKAYGHTKDRLKTGSITS